MAALKAAATAPDEGDTGQKSDEEEEEEEEDNEEEEEGEEEKGKRVQVTVVMSKEEEEEEKDEEEEEEEEERPTCWERTVAASKLLHPHPNPSTDPREWQDSEQFLKFWYTITVLNLLYTTIFLPIRICFNVQAQIPWLVLDVLSDIIHFVDIFVKTRTAAEVKGFFITNRRHIFSLYKNRFHQGLVHDLLTGLPVDYILYITSGYNCLYRVNRILRITYFAKFFHLFEDYNPHISGNVIRMFKSAGSMILTAHLLGCGFFLILRIEGESDSDKLWPKGGRTLLWQGYPDLFELSVPRQYVRALYWAFISMTGYGNTIPVRTGETLYTILVTLVGLSIYVNVIGTVGSLVTSLEATSQAHRTKMDTFNDWMRYRRIPQSTILKVKAYHKYMWQTRKGVDESQLLGDLPTYLRLEVSEFINRDIIQKVPLFKDVSKAFLNAVLLHLQPRVVLADAYICKTGDVGAEMYFISSGVVNVVLEEEGKPPKVVATLTDGCFFGEVALIYQTKRTATVVAHTVCEMYILKKVHFEEVLEEFSEYAVAILEKAAERFGAQSGNAKLRK